MSKLLSQSCMPIQSEPLSASTFFCNISKALSNRTNWATNYYLTLSPLYPISYLTYQYTLSSFALLALFFSHQIFSISNILQLKY